MRPFIRSTTGFKRLSSLQNQPDKVLIVHCAQQLASENLSGYSPRILAIAIRSLDDSAYESFAIHLEAEKAGVERETIDDFYDELEYQMLFEFNNFVKRNPNCSWLHWNMNNIDYGFAAINHRFKILQGMYGDGKDIYYAIQSYDKVNVPHLIADIYGDDFVNSPQMLNLFKINNDGQKHMNFLSTVEETSAFEARYYPRVLTSVHTKLDFIALVVKNVCSNRLKVQNRNFRAYVNHIVTHPLVIVFTFLSGVTSLGVALWQMFLWLK